MKKAGARGRGVSKKAGGGRSKKAYGAGGGGGVSKKGCMGVGV